MKKLSAIVLSLNVILFSNNAIAFDDPNGHFTSNKVGGTTENYKKITEETKKSRMGKIVGNIKKIAKPNAIGIAVTVGVGLADYVMNPDNNRPQPQPEPAPAPAPAPSTGCKVEFGSTASHSPLGAYIAGINSRTTYNGKGGYTYNVSGESIDVLTRAGATALEKYSKTNKAVPLTNVSNTNIRIEVTDPNNKKFNHYINTGVFVSCVEPAPQPEENPQDKPQEQPQPQPQPVPAPAPVPSPTPNNDPNADPNAQPSPSPNGQPSPSPSPNGQPSPSPSPNGQPSPNNNPNAQPQPVPNPNAQPNPATTPEEYEFNLEFEFPAFCDWAKPVCDFIEWFKDEPKPPQQESPIIDEKPLTRSVSEFDVMYLRFGGQCPAPVTHNLGLNNATFTIDLSPLCQFAILVRPVVLAMAYFLAIGIIANAIRDT